MIEAIIMHHHGFVSIFLLEEEEQTEAPVEEGFCVVLHIVGSTHLVCTEKYVGNLFFKRQLVGFIRIIISHYVDEPSQSSSRSAVFRLIFPTPDMYISPVISVKPINKSVHNPTN